MTISTTRVGFFAVAAALVVATACGKTTSATDEALKRDLAAATSAGGDLELAPRAARPQVVLSAIEGGPAAAPKRAAARSTTPAPVRRPVQPRKTETATPRAAVKSEAPAPSRAEPAPAPTVEPPPLPPATRGPSSRQQGTYKTEAEIFRQMPWIRP